MDRRNFVKTAVLGASVLGAAKTFAGENTKAKKFNVKFAPHFGQFDASAGKNPVDKIKFFADCGFTAFEDNGMMKRPVEVQEAITKERERLGMDMGIFLAYANFKSPLMISNRFELKDRNEDKKGVREFLKKRMEEAVECSKRVHTKLCTVVPGCFDERLDYGYQFANVMDNLKFCSEICEKAGLVMVLEPLNPKNHPNLWLKTINQAYALCKAVNSPSCKILFDIYHQQITEGNIIYNIKQAWSEIGYYQMGEVPGRKEPCDGEINYKNIFKVLKENGYNGVIGMEHGQKANTKEGDQHLIDSYRAIDLDA